MKRFSISPESNRLKILLGSWQAGSLPHVLCQVAVFEEGEGEEHGDGAVEDAIDEGPGEVLHWDGDAGGDARLNVEVVEDRKHRGDEAAEEDDGR